ncbi:MAG: glutathionylspermidine synthase family protein [Pseudomonadota bacterium]|nr:glutathionylspermidine synthase family protein [Pseudomonadota bacterium]
MKYNNIQQYRSYWQQINQKLIKQHFLWGWLYEMDEWHQYLALDIYKMSRVHWNHIITATADIAYLLQKIYFLIQNDIELFIQLGLPVSAYGLKKVKTPYFSYFSRMDLIVRDQDIKIIEINCDTPLGFLEASVCNRLICKEHGYDSPNQIESAIQAAWQQIKKDYAIPKTETLYFTAYDWADEDRETANFIKENCLFQPTEFIDIGDLVVTETGIFTPQGDKINWLYRLYPLEYLDDDIDEAGNKIGQLFLQHIVQGNIKIINPPSALLMQSKAVLALIYALFLEESEHLTETELQLIERYFLPTYFEADYFKNNHQPYVIKPIWGREGEGITLVDAKGNIMQQDENDYYKNQKNIYQQYVKMPEFTIYTWNGEYSGQYVIGSFLINATPAGLFLRVGEAITGNLSMFCPVTVVD